MNKLTQATEFELEIIESSPAEKTDRPPLLFIHGAYAGAWCWQPNFLPYFAERGYRGFALSLRGHGGSAGAAELSAWRIADYAGDLARVAAQVEARCGRKPVLVGHSMGGFLAQMHARKHAVAGLALLATVPPEGLIGSALHLLWRHPRLMWELNALQHGGVPPRLDKLRELLFSPQMPERELLEYATRFQHESDRALIDMTLPQLDYRPPLGMPPALVLGSEDDLLMPVHLIYSAARQLEVHAQMLKGPGHLLMLDRDWRLAADALAGWLEELP